MGRGKGLQGRTTSAPSSDLLHGLVHKLLAQELAHHAVHDRPEVLLLPELLELGHHRVHHLLPVALDLCRARGGARDSVCAKVCMRVPGTIYVPSTCAPALLAPYAPSPGQSSCLPCPWHSPRASPRSAPRRGPPRWRRPGASASSRRRGGLRRGKAGGEIGPSADIF